jgi:hypothetical protein
LNPAAETPSAVPAATPQPQPRAGVISDAAYDALPAADRDRYARVRKGPQGGSEWMARDKLPPEPADPTKSTTTTTTDDGKPSVTADGKLRVGSMELDEGDIRKIMAESAMRESRKATMPADAAGYTLNLPADLKLPDGMTWKWATDHPVQGPLLAAAKEFAFANGIDQAGFSKMMGLFVAHQTHEAQVVNQAKAAELAKLGATATARVDSITQFVRGMTGDDKLAASVTSMLFTADQVRAWEKIIGRITNQGVASFRQDGRELNTGGKGPLSSMSDEQYNAMSASERFRVSRLGN